MSFDIQYETLGLWDGDEKSEIIKLHGDYYLLGTFDRESKMHRGCVKLEKSHIKRYNDYLSTIEPLDGFREDCKTKYTITPIFRYEVESVDVSRFEGIPDEDMGMEMFSEWSEAHEILDYKVEKEE